MRSSLRPKRFIIEGYLGKPPRGRLPLISLMCSQLIRHERIETVLSRARQLSRFTDRMVTLGKMGTLMAAQRAAKLLHTEAVVHKLFTELAYRYRDRCGGYTRVVKAYVSDRGSVKRGFIEFVDREFELKAANPGVPNPPKNRPIDPWTRSRLTKCYALPKFPKSNSRE